MSEDEDEGEEQVRTPRPPKNREGLSPASYDLPSEALSACPGSCELTHDRTFGAGTVQLHEGLLEVLTAVLQPNLPDAQQLYYAVDHVTLRIPQYPRIVMHPLCLAQIEIRICSVLKAHKPEDDVVKVEAVKAEAVEAEGVKAEAVEAEAVKAEAVKAEVVEPEVVQVEDASPPASPALSPSAKVAPSAFACVPPSLGIEDSSAAKTEETSAAKTEETSAAEEAQSSAMQPSLPIPCAACTRHASFASLQEFAFAVRHVVEMCWMFNHHFTPIHQLALRLWRVAETEIRRLAALDPSVFHVDIAWLDGLATRELVRGLHIHCPSPGERRELREAAGLPHVVARRMAKRVFLKYPRRMGTLWGRRQKACSDPMVDESDPDAWLTAAEPLKRPRRQPSNKHQSWGRARKSIKIHPGATPGCELQTPVMEPLSMATPDRAGKIEPMTPLSPPKRGAKFCDGMDSIVDMVDVSCDASPAQQHASAASREMLCRGSHACMEELPRIRI
jgi:hypothetical protein